MNRARLGARATAVRRDRGAADALALVLIAPVAVGFALLIVSLGRSVESRSETQMVAESAAQAAALERSPGAARAAAQAVADAMLTNPDTCANPRVDVDPDEFRPGGSVAVTISCFATNRGIEGVQEDPIAFTTRAVAQVDPFRATEGP